METIMFALLDLTFWQSLPNLFQYVKMNGSLVFAFEISSATSFSLHQIYSIHSLRKIDWTNKKKSLLNSRKLFFISMKMKIAQCYQRIRMVLIFYTRNFLDDFLPRSCTLLTIPFTRSSASCVVYNSEK